jgi:hypothetical protein
MPTNQSNQYLAIRNTKQNANHHLWNNNGSWWLHFTLRNENGAQKRHRFSLKTSDLITARRRRDGILLDLQSQSGRIAA